LSYDPSEDAYWDPDLLKLEITRIFEVCHGCRLCFKYCDSFPTLFDLIDDHYEGDVRRLTDADVGRVMDACFQCKLCEVQCPYTPRDGHEFQLDFPRLVHRYRAIRTRKHGTALRARVLGDPDGLAWMARLSLGMANLFSRVRIVRWLMEKVLGIHRDKALPDFAGTTFERWAERAGRVNEEPGGETVLFQTCFVQNNDPQIGRDTLEVLDRNQVECRCVKGLECCGMPAWEHGDLESVREHARANLDKLVPFVEAGARVVVLQPTCSMMLRNEYPELVAPEDRDRARKLADAVVDPGEFLWSIRKEDRFNTDFQSTPGGTIAYHAPCHLRAQRVGFRGRDLLRRVPGVTIQSVMECCGHNGTFAMTVEGFEPAARVGKNAFEQMKGHEAETWVSECALAGVQFRQHAGKGTEHPMSVLARAYRPHGFGEAKQIEDQKERDS